MGVWRQRLSLRIKVAASKPSISGMRTSSRMSAKADFRIERSASRPEEAVTTVRSGPESSDSRALRLCGSSSTTRMLAEAESVREVIGRRLSGLLVQPHPQQRRQLLDVHRLRDVVRRTRLEAFLAIALHRLRGQGDDRQGPELRVPADDPDGVVAVELRHHDVHQHQLDVRLALEDLDPFLAASPFKTGHPPWLGCAGRRETVAHVILYTRAF